jgi:prenyltransferase beta subunit
LAQAVRQRPLSPEFWFNPREVRENFVVAMRQKAGTFSKYFDLLPDIYHSIFINKYGRANLAAILFQLISHMVTNIHCIIS